MSEIKATVIKDSIAKNGKRITTFELEYHRFIHGEVMTHRMFSRNAASSRAIPMAKVIKQVLAAPAVPIHWGKNQRGMQAQKELNPLLKIVAKSTWIIASWFAVIFALILKGIGLHKQIGNRILEPWQMMKVVLTATEFENFFNLRCHKDAQPEIYVLATLMREAMEKSIPYELEEGEYHLPYIHTEWDNGEVIYSLQGLPLRVLTTKQAVMVSISCCAQVSYRVLDTSLNKGKVVFDKLYHADPFHASPFEHVATPSKSVNYKSGNFQGWKQLRCNMKTFEDMED